MKLPVLNVCHMRSICINIVAIASAAAQLGTTLNLTCQLQGCFVRVVACDMLDFSTLSLAALSSLASVANQPTWLAHANGTCSWLSMNGTGCMKSLGLCSECAPQV